MGVGVVVAEAYEEVLAGSVREMITACEVECWELMTVCEEVNLIWVLG